MFWKKIIETWKSSCWPVNDICKKMSVSRIASFSRCFIQRSCRSTDCAAIWCPTKTHPFSWTDWTSIRIWTSRWRITSSVRRTTRISAVDSSAASHRLKCTGRCSWPDVGQYLFIESALLAFVRKCDRPAIRYIALSEDGEPIEYRARLRLGGPTWRQEWTRRWVEVLSTCRPHTMNHRTHGAFFVFKRCDWLARYRTLCDVCRSAISYELVLKGGALYFSRITYSCRDVVVLRLPTEIGNSSVATRITDEGEGSVRHTRLQSKRCVWPLDHANRLTVESNRVASGCVGSFAINPP